MEDLEAQIAARLDDGARREAMTIAIKGYGPQILGYLMTILRHEDVARDVFAETCERLWTALASFRREGTFRAWAYRIAWNAAQDHFRGASARRERRLETAELSHLAASVASSTPPPPGPSTALDRVARLRAQLSAEEQTLITLRVSQQLSWAEIAEVLSRPGLPESEATLRKRFERVKRKLRELASAEGAGE